MRLPAGYRATLAEAFEAALESSIMTGLRYSVKVWGVDGITFAFMPAQHAELTQHDIVQV